MHKILRTGFLLSLLALISGCAGSDFVRPSADIFKLGQTTYSQVIQKMGEPRRVGDVVKNEKQVKSISYSYATKGGEPLEEDVIPARALVYFFHNHTLVGQEFVSSFKSDNSNFDDTKIDTIKKGKTTRSEVIQLLGKPTALYIHPMVKENSGEAIGYTYSTSRGSAFTGLKFYRKALRISFDNRNLVSDIDYASSGNK